MPGASLAVLADGNIHEMASGVLHLDVTTDSVFQIGLISKGHTSTNPPTQQPQPAAPSNHYLSCLP
jgi:hypothetical protein